MILNILILIISLLILAKASETSIKYSMRVSKLLGISQMAIGFIIISLITSLPELSIAVISALGGNAELGIGNLIGCSIVDICLVFGILAIFKTIRPSHEDYKEIIRTVSITSIVGFVFIMLGRLNILFGIFCLIVFFLFFFSVWKSNYRLKVKPVKYKNLKIIEVIKSLNFLILSIIFVIASAKFVTDSAVAISTALGLSEILIGATIIATGTTLPELAITLAAIRRKNISLAIGDIIGSLVIHLTLAFGIVSFITTVVMTPMIEYLTMFLLIVNMIFIFLSSTLKYSRSQGLLLISTYVIFMISMFVFQFYFI